VEEIHLRVAKAYPNDSGRGIARLDPNTLLELKLSPGDIIEIKGKSTTAAKVWRADKQDWAQGIVRIDGFVRQNADIGIGEKVTIKKADVKEAEKVVLAPLEGMTMQFGSEAEDMIKRQVQKHPVVQGDIVPVISSMGYPFMSRMTAGQAIPLIAVSTTPTGIVLITETTLLELREKPVTGYEAVRATGITYEAIGGLRDEVQRVREMIELPMKHPEVFQRLGIDPPKGVLLHGPPGTGKTLIAKAVANEAGASFFSIAGPEIMSKFYGESEFIDELDSIAPKREEVTGEVERRVVAQLLSMMDGLEERGQVVVIGATNRVDAIDPALRRPGRFDREIEIGVPDKSDRVEILQIHTRGMPLSEDVDMGYLAEHTHGFVGADISALAKEAAMRALRRHLPEINLDEDTIPPDVLEKMHVTIEDITHALREIEPSALREIFIEIPKVSWDDVGGLEDVKQEIVEAVEWPLRCPEKFAKMGISPPRGILLYGPPGTGKTLLAKAVANESNANFISVRGPQLLSKWVGESEKAVRQVFKKARQCAPVIIFFDELDALAPARSAEDVSKASERVVNQLLTELDGLEKLEDVVVMGATNRPDLIDPALLRPGRFDRLVLVGAPDKLSRTKIFEIHMRDMPLAEDVSIDELADITEGYVGSDIAALCREAAMLALRENIESKQVEMRHFREVLKKVKPTIDESIMSYYERIKERFKGGTAVEARSYIGYR